MARRPAGQDHDPSRREFFKTFSRQTIQNAGAVAGAAAELRRTSLEAARELLDFDTPPPAKAPTAVGKSLHRDGERAAGDLPQRVSVHAARPSSCSISASCPPG